MTFRQTDITSSYLTTSFHVTRRNHENIQKREAVSTLVVTNIYLIGLIACPIRQNFLQGTNYQILRDRDVMDLEVNLQLLLYKTSILPQYILSIFPYTHSLSVVPIIHKGIWFLYVIRLYLSLQSAFKKLII